MAIRSATNLYPGINAHLNSFLQQVEGEWRSFHTAHIVDLARALNRVLPTGYEARVTKSLQIMQSAAEGDPGARRRRPEPDVMIVSVSVDPIRQAALSTVPVAQAAALTSSVLETMDEDPDTLLEAVVIYKISDEASLVGRAVTRIELLSPTNKPPTAGYEQYREKRNLTLRSGTPLVEIDYLHQLRPAVKNVPSYPDREVGAQAYAICVSDPRPSLAAGLATLYLFDVDAPFPLIDIPLETPAQVIGFSLAEAYSQTFENTPTYIRVVDYAQLPLGFETYTLADQQRIMQRMLSITL